MTRIDRSLAFDRVPAQPLPAVQADALDLPTVRQARPPVAPPAPVQDIEAAAAEAPLFGNQTEDEIALATALLVVRYEDDVAQSAPPEVQRGHAALADTARMFEHLALLRSMRNPGDKP